MPVAHQDDKVFRTDSAAMPLDVFNRGNAPESQRQSKVHAISERSPGRGLVNAKAAWIRRIDAFILSDFQTASVCNDREAGRSLNYRRNGETGRQHTS